MRKIKMETLLNLSTNKREQKCNCECETNKCLFNKKLWKYREDGFCIANTYKNVDKWIKEDEEEINDLQNKIKICKKRIKKYKALKEKINMEIKNESKGY